MNKLTLYDLYAFLTAATFTVSCLVYIDIWLQVGIWYDNWKRGGKPKDEDAQWWINRYEQQRRWCLILIIYVLALWLFLAGELDFFN